MPVGLFSGFLEGTGWQEPQPASPGTGFCFLSPWLHLCLFTCSEDHTKAPHRPLGDQRHTADHLFCCCGVCSDPSGSLGTHLPRAGPVLAGAPTAEAGWLLLESGQRRAALPGAHGGGTSPSALESRASPPPASSPMLPEQTLERCQLCACARLWGWPLSGQVPSYAGGPTEMHSHVVSTLSALCI